MNADPRGRRAPGSGSRTLLALAFAGLSACSWFTDFKEQPKIDPWDTPADTIPPRANPVGSVPVTGQVAPAYMYDRAGTPAALASMQGLTNPLAGDTAAAMRGKLQYQINCAVCHGPSGGGLGPITKYAGGLMAPPALGPGSPSVGHSDGYLFAVIRNGKNTMPSYNRIEERERWEIVNYLRMLQQLGPAADTTHGRPGETGLYLPGASATAPTRPARAYRVSPATLEQPAVLPGTTMLPGAAGPPAVPPPHTVPPDSIGVRP